MAIEIGQKCYIPMLDCQGNIRCLVDSERKSVVESYDFTAFGEESSTKRSPINPWRYASKRFDSGVQLINFGKRYYDPQLGRWLTMDPAGFIDGSNPYQFNFNNPFMYQDPDGQIIQFALVLPLLAWGGAGFAIALPSITTILTTVVVSAVVVYGTEVALRKFDNYMSQELQEERKPPRLSGKELGNDPRKCPESGFEWRGRGTPESGKGSWYNQETGEIVHPDLDHPPPVKPHWDYVNTDGKGARLFLDGRHEWK